MNNSFRKWSIHAPVFHIYIPLLKTALQFPQFIFILLSIKSGCYARIVDASLKTTHAASYSSAIVSKLVVVSAVTSRQLTLFGKAEAGRKVYIYS